MVEPAFNLSPPAKWMAECVNFSYAGTVPFIKQDLLFLTECEDGFQDHDKCQNFLALFS